MRLTKLAATIGCVTLSGLALVACSSDSTAGTDAVAVGGTFQFHSPDGKMEIFYDEADRQQLPDIGGDSLMEEAHRSTCLISKTKLSSSMRGGSGVHRAAPNPMISRLSMRNSKLPETATPLVAPCWVSMCVITPATSPKTLSPTTALITQAFTIHHL